MSYEQLAEYLTNQFEETVSWRRHLHQHPELSFKETNTKHYIIEKLKEFGYEDVQEIGGGSVVTYLKGSEAGPTIAFRADFDALPIEEQTNLPFASKNPGVMHACGHDGHTSILLSVAKALKENAVALNGTIKFIFQHAEEEYPGGAQALIADGALEDVDEIYGLHVLTGEEYGRVYYRPGYYLAAADTFTITIQGKGGHASRPNETVDPIVISSHIISQLQTVISRNKDPRDAGVLSFSTIKGGDGSSNIIPDTVFLKGTVRTFKPEVRNLIEEKIKRISEDVSHAHDASAEVVYTRGYPATYNHPEQANRLGEIFTDTFQSENVVEIEPRMPAEDFAYYLLEKPGAFFHVSVGNEEKGIVYPNHHPKFDLDERALLLGGKAFLAIVDSYLIKDR